MRFFVQVKQPFFDQNDPKLVAKLKLLLFQKVDAFMQISIEIGSNDDVLMQAKDLKWIFGHFPHYSAGVFLRNRRVSADNENQYSLTKKGYELCHKFLSRHIILIGPLKGGGCLKVEKSGIYLDFYIFTKDSFAHRKVFEHQSVWHQRYTVQYSIEYNTRNAWTPIL